MPLCLPATSIHQRINPFEPRALPAPFYVGVSSRACFSSTTLLTALPVLRKLAFHEQVVCFAVRAPFASLFVRRSKAGGLQPPVAMAAVRGQERGRRIHLFLLAFFLFIRFYPPLVEHANLYALNLIRELLENAGDFYWEILRSLDLIVSDRRVAMLSSRWSEQTSVFCRAFQFVVSSLCFASPRYVHQLQRFRNARAHFFASVSGRIGQTGRQIRRAEFCQSRR